jgi:hypothetical protein
MRCLCLKKNAPQKLDKIKANDERRMVEYQRNGWDHHERQQTAAATQDTIEGL